jgi:hypothetical protein
MAAKKTLWKKGPGKLGALHPLIGAWRAESDSPMGRLVCTRTFTPMPGGKFVELRAEWKFAAFTYVELAVYGIRDGKLGFWSFTSDGKRSEGYVGNGKDLHPEAVCFEAKMPAGLARMVYWPDGEGGVHWAVESKTQKGWHRFTEHHYHRARGEDTTRRDRKR